MFFCAITANCGGMTTIVYLYCVIQITAFTATFAVEETFTVAGFAVVVSIISECIIDVHPIPAFLALTVVFVFS